MKLFDIPGYQGKYKITDSGKIFSVARFVAESGRAGRFYKEKELKQQIDKYGNIINRFESVTTAAIATNSCKRYIIDCCNQKLCKYKNYIWRYENEIV